MQDKEKDDVVVEYGKEAEVSDVDIDELEGDLKAKLKEVKTKLAAAEKEKQEYLTGWQRAKADFVNASRRAEEDRRELSKYASESVIEELLPVLDSFESALQTKEEGQWKEGLMRMHSQLLSVLKARGLESIDAVNVPMDPRSHEAIQLVSGVTDHPPNTVMTILQKGYRIHDRVLRAAKVVVSE